MDGSTWPGPEKIKWEVPKKFSSKEALGRRCIVNALPWTTSALRPFQNYFLFRLSAPQAIYIRPLTLIVKCVKNEILIFSTKYYFKRHLYKLLVVTKVSCKLNTISDIITTEDYWFDVIGSKKPGRAIT